MGQFRGIWSHYVGTAGPPRRRTKPEERLSPASRHSDAAVPHFRRGSEPLPASRGPSQRCPLSLMSPSADDSSPSCTTSRWRCETSGRRGVAAASTRFSLPSSVGLMRTGIRRPGRPWRSSAGRRRSVSWMRWTASLAQERVVHPECGEQTADTSREPFDSRCRRPPPVVFPARALATVVGDESCEELDLRLVE